MNINLTFDQPVNTLPAGFVASLNAVVQFLDSQFNNPITININVGYGEVDGQQLDPGALGESETFLNQYSYSALRNALVLDAGSSDQVAAANSLPASDPTPGGSGNYWVATAEAKALGLMGASSATDGFIGFANHGVAFTYNTTNGGPVASGTYDFFGVAAHEITEVLGRALLVGGTVFTNPGTVTNSYEPMDLFHYSSNNHRTFSGTTPGYFSPDGGATNLNNFNTNSSGDFGDWANSAGNDSFRAFSNSSVANPVSNADLRVMNVLGYDVAGPPPAGFVGDFNGDTHSDLLWQATNGRPTEWLMNGTTITTPQGLPNSGPSWRVITTGGDFNLDGNSDILWQNTDGMPFIWEMNGTSMIGSAPLPNSGPSWHVIGVADFSRDGKSDIMWQNTDGTAVIWVMNGTSLVGGTKLPYPGSTWHMIGAGDFNADGNSDILWQNADGAPAIWEMNGTTLVGGAVLPNSGPSWHVIGAADFTGDGKSDIIWQNTDGTPVIWVMNGTSFSGAVLPNPGASWQLVGTGNYATTHPDLVFLNTSTDQVQIWVMNGLNIASMQTIATPAPSAAQPAASALATPLNATPVLYNPDASSAGPTGGFGAPVLVADEATNPLFGRT